SLTALKIWCNDKCTLCEEKSLAFGSNIEVGKKYYIHGIGASEAPKNFCIFRAPKTSIKEIY
uniref:Uncharacterized protein n=1 Tax=Romanomermis culicivorax TaxID=13658 RepID=A0A915HPF0_ROMCU